MPSSRLRAVVLVIAASLSPHARRNVLMAHPVRRSSPIASQDFQARAAGELDSLPAGSAIEQMLADYENDAGSGAGVRALRREPRF
jgi:hypothetical protein